MRKLKLFFACLLMAVLSIGQVWADDPAAVGTTLFSEDFSSYSADDVPSGSVSAATGRVIYGGGSVTYTSTNGTGTKPGTTKIWNENTGGGKAPEILVGKQGTSGTPGSFKIAGIPSGGAQVITVSWTQNKQLLTGILEGTGYSTTYTFPKPTTTTATISFDITVADGADETFDLTLRASSSNVRVDDILITVKTAGEGGSSTPTCATPTFSPAAGTYASAQNVTISCTTEDATIHYTIDGTEPTTSSPAYSSAIAVSTTTTIKAIAVKSGLDNSAVATAAYTILSLEHAGTAEDPYTVADARNAIDANTGITGVYATGIVSEIVTPFDSRYGNITYNISADGQTTSDQLQAYRGKDKDGEKFTSEDDVRVGDEVVVYGTLKKYNSTYEFDQNNQLYALVARTPNFEIADVPYLYTTDEDLDITSLVTKEGNGTITLVSGNTDIATIVDGKIHPVAAGNVTITAYLAADAPWRAANTNFKVSVIAPCTNKLNLIKGAEDENEGTFEMSLAEGEHPTCDGAIDVVVTPSPAEHYHVADVTATGATIKNNGDGTWTVTFAQDFSGDATINVSFVEDTHFAVKWFANEKLIATEKYYEGQTISEHAAPAALSPVYSDKVFIGWVEAELSEATDVRPDLADFTSMSAAEKTFFALYATATAGSGESLIKQGSDAAFAAGDNLVIVAIDAEENAYALYQETVSNSYVKNWAFVNNVETVAADAKNYVTLEAAPDGKFYLGDATNGYVYSSGSNNLSVDASNKTAWTIEWDADDSKFTFSQGRYLSCRTDLTSDKVNLFRLAGGTPLGIYKLDVYKYVSVSYTYSAYVTTVPEATFTVKWSYSGGTEELGEMTKMGETDTYEWYVAKKSIRNADTYTVKVFKDDQTDYVVAGDLGITPAGTYELRFDYDPTATDPEKVLVLAAKWIEGVNTDIDNTVDGKKAVKFIENGQLFIEMNGHIYNVQGQTVK